MSWNESNISDLTGKTIVVTGANTGVGFEAAKILAAHNAQVVLACRSNERMAAAASAIMSEHPNASLLQLQVDLSDLDSVRSFAEALRAAVSKIDVLLLNAGVALTDYKESAQGYETMFATNHLGHYLLVGLLLDLMKDVPGSRVVSVSSIGHNFTHDINYAVAKGTDEEKFQYFKAYCDTKLANQWFVQELQKRFAAGGAKTFAVACHPGNSSTDLARHVGSNPIMTAVLWLTSVFQHSAKQGSLPLVMACVAEDVTEGCYCGPKDWWGLKGLPTKNGGVSKTVYDTKKSSELWEVSEELTGFKYAI